MLSASISVGDLRLMGLAPISLSFLVSSVREREAKGPRPKDPPAWAGYRR